MTSELKLKKFRFHMLIIGWVVMPCTWAAKQDTGEEIAAPGCIEWDWSSTGGALSHVLQYRLRALKDIIDEKSNP